MNVVSTAQVLPRTPADVGGFISVVFVGPGKFKLEQLGTTFQVRKSKVWSLPREWNPSWPVWSCRRGQWVECKGHFWGRNCWMTPLMVWNQFHFLKKWVFLTLSLLIPISLYTVGHIPFPSTTTQIYFLHFHFSCKHVIHWLFLIVLSDIINSMFLLYGTFFNVAWHISTPPCLVANPTSNMLPIRSHSCHLKFWWEKGIGFTQARQCYISPCTRLRGFKDIYPKWDSQLLWFFWPPTPLFHLQPKCRT